MGLTFFSFDEFGVGVLPKKEEFLIVKEKVRLLEEKRFGLKHQFRKMFPESRAHQYSDWEKEQFADVIGEG